MAKKKPLLRATEAISLPQKQTSLFDESALSCKVSSANLSMTTDRDDKSSVNRTRPLPPACKGIVPLVGGAELTARLGAALEKVRPSQFYLQLDPGPSFCPKTEKFRPEIAATRVMISAALDQIRRVMPHAPYPLVVGLAKVDANYLALLQPSLVMPGLGGFDERGPEVFVQEVGTRLIDPDSLPADRWLTPRISHTSFR